VPLDKIGWRDRLVLELTDGERGPVSGHFGPERHLDTGTVLHGCIEDRFCNRDVLACPLGELGNKRVKIFAHMVSERGLHRFITRMEGKDGGVDTVARDIFDVFVVHDRVNEPVPEEILVHVVMDLLDLDRVQFDPVIMDDIFGCSPEFLARFVPGNVLGVDIKGLKEPLL